MEHEESYEIITTDKGMLVFALKGRQGRPQSPFLLYDGGRHATFYRRPNEVILIDYINDRVLCELSKAQQILIVEIDRERNCVVDAYFPSDYADEVSITENKATVVFVIGSVKDSQTIVLKN